jgi:hypothetical protein
MLRGPVQLRLKIILSKNSVFEERENQQLPDFAQDLSLGADDASLPVGPQNPSTAGRRHSVAMSPFHHAASRQVYR